MGMVVTVSNKKNKLLYLLRTMKLFMGCALMGVAAMLLPIQLSAGDWVVSPQVSVTGTYTDNANLSSSDESDTFYTQISPAVTITREGSGRVQADINYALDYIENRPGNRGQDIAHSLASYMQAELYEDVIFLDVSAGANLGSATSGGQRGEGSVGDVSDPIQTYTYSISPYFRQRFGRYVDTVMRYTFDQVINSGGRGLDSNSNQGSLMINSGAYFVRIPWNINYQYSKTNYEGGIRNSDTASINGTVGYVISRKWRVNLGGSYTDNDIQSSRSSTDGFFWNMGTTWTPNPRTSMSFLYSPQFFGENYGFDFSHRSRRAVWNASYSKTFTNSRSQQMMRATEIRRSSDDYGDSYLFSNGQEYNYLGSEEDADGNISYLYGRDIDYATLTDEYFVLETFNTGFLLGTRRSSLNVNAYFTNRKYELARTQARDIGVTVDWDRRLSQNTDASIGLSWRKNRADENAREDTRWVLRLGLSKSLTVYTNVNLNYLHRRLEASDSGANEYRENQISLSLSSQW